MTCQAPWHGVTAALKPAQRVEARAASACAKTTPEVPIVAETTPCRTMPLPTAPAGWSPPPPTTGVPSGQAGRLRPELAHVRRRPPGSHDKAARAPDRSRACPGAAGSSGDWRRPEAASPRRRSPRWRRCRSAGSGRSPWEAAPDAPAPSSGARGCGPRATWAR